MGEIHTVFANQEVVRHLPSTETSNHPEGVVPWMAISSAQASSAVDR